MKVLFNYHIPYSLAHGGAQIQIEETSRALNAIGVEAEPLRWWDDQQQGDILHQFARITPDLALAAKRKGMKVVISDLLTAPGSRSRPRIRVQQVAQRLVQTLGPNMLVNHFGWQSYQLADALLILTPWEAELLWRLYNAPRDRIHVVPNGVEDVFLKSAPTPRGPWLVCTGIITERKRMLELAQAAVRARTPLWVIGKPYHPDEPYAKRFLDLARTHPEFVCYEGPIQDRVRLATIYRAARGFVLLSTMESLSLSALEAAACECPLLLSDLPWARTVFKERASYCVISGQETQTAQTLRQFYDAAPTLPPPPKPLTWIEVAQQIKGIYERILNTSR